MQDVVASLPCAGALDCDQVRYVFDDTDQVGITAVVQTNFAMNAFGKVAAGLAAANCGLRFLHRSNEALHGLWFLNQQVQGNAFGGAEAQTWESF